MRKTRERGTQIVLCNGHCTGTHELDTDNIWACRCACGREINVCGICLEEGAIMSCGQCSRREA
jgi:hypothetical protein